MPPYPWLADNDLDYSDLESKLSVLEYLGVPYVDYLNGQDPVENLKNQEAQIADGLRSGGIQVENNKEIIAIIAYLQRLGTDLYNGNSQAQLNSK
jgi:cytochrome c oxidase cbb3-type subunit I/II